MLEVIQNIDWALLHAICNTLSCGLLDFLMPKITALGNVGAVWLVAAVLLTVSKKYRAYGIALFAGLAVAFLVGNVFLKNVFARPRPCWLEDVSMLIAMPTDYSFPSGHTLGSVIGAYVLTAANRKFGLVAIPLAALIALSRMYLFVHFPSDILAAVLLGVLIGFAAVKFARHLQAHGANVQQESRKSSCVMRKHCVE